MTLYTEHVLTPYITREHEVKLCSLALFFCSKLSLRKDVTVEIRQVNSAERPPISVTALVQYPTYIVDLPASSKSEGNILRQVQKSVQDHVEVQLRN